MPAYNSIDRNDLAGCVFGCRPGQFPEPDFVSFLREVLVKMNNRKNPQSYSSEFSAEAALLFIRKSETRIKTANRNDVLEPDEFAPVFNMLAGDLSAEKNNLLKDKTALSQQELEQNSTLDAQITECKDFARKLG